MYVSKPATRIPAFPTTTWSGRPEESEYSAFQTLIAHILVAVNVDKVLVLRQGEKNEPAFHSDRRHTCGDFRKCSFEGGTPRK